MDPQNNPPQRQSQPQRPEINLVKNELQRLIGSFFKPALVSLGKPDLPIQIGPSENPDKTPCLILMLESALSNQAFPSITQLDKQKARSENSYELVGQIHALANQFENRLLPSELLIGFSLLLKEHKNPIYTFSEITNYQLIDKEDNQILHAASSSFKWQAALSMEINQAGICLSGDNKDIVTDHVPQITTDISGQIAVINPSQARPGGQSGSITLKGVPAGQAEDAAMRAIKDNLGL